MRQAWISDLDALNQSVFTKPKMHFLAKRFWWLIKVTAKDWEKSLTLRDYSSFKKRKLRPDQRRVNDQSLFDAKASLGQHEIDKLGLTASLEEFFYNLLPAKSDQGIVWQNGIDKAIMNFVPRYVRIVLGHIRLISEVHDPPLFQPKELNELQKAAFEYLKDFLSEVFTGRIQERKGSTASSSSEQKFNWDKEVNLIRTEFMKNEKRTFRHRLASTWKITELWMKTNLTPFYETLNSNEGSHFLFYKNLINDRAWVEEKYPRSAESFKKFKLRLPKCLLERKPSDQ
ncbi:hypothetical protein O181_068588 [Austropuccinia psidii MF-1]|uniref:Uncharacterized protein n=1 Tax=Austropuccinia psidii MF-1 TaxID=1389203 RepID=A0A9Q3EVJ2_9BASI|nr:hypothetical protein [Austropuccinia psidii MF-1]